MIGIYKITNPNNKVYIGQSVNIKERLKKYKKIQCNTQIKIFNSLNKYGVENHTFEVIEECSIELLNERERYWQDYYNVLENGLNCILTKTNNKSGYLSKEIKNKISKSNLGKKHTENTILKIKEIQNNRNIEWIENNKKACKNNVFSKKAKINSLKYLIGNKHNLGKKHTEESKLKMSLAKKGKKSNRINFKFSEESKLKISLSKKNIKIGGKLVLNIYTGIYYNSLNEASFYNCICPKQASRKLNGTRKNNTNLIYV
jgi:group I intron endonuclease